MTSAGYFPGLPLPPYRSQATAWVCLPGKRSATEGKTARMNKDGRSLTSIREPAAGVTPDRVIQAILLPVRVGYQRLWRHIHITLPAGGRIAHVEQRMARGIILRLLNIHRRPHEPVAGNSSLNQRPGSVTKALTAAALLRQLTGIGPIV